MDHSEYSYLGTATSRKMEKITSLTVSPSISYSGLKIIRCSRTWGAMNLMSSGMTKSLPDRAAWVALGLRRSSPRGGFLFFERCRRCRWATCSSRKFVTELAQGGIYCTGGEDLFGECFQASCGKVQFFVTAWLVHGDFQEKVVPEISDKLLFRRRGINIEKG